MALRIKRWLGRDHGGAAEVWLAQQAHYDLSQPNRHHQKQRSPARNAGL
jgi:plasmid maintenance system antidote protein VapI